MYNCGDSFECDRHIVQRICSSTGAGAVYLQVPMDACGSDMEDAGDDAGVSKIVPPTSPSADDADANNGSSNGETLGEDENEGRDGDADGDKK